MYAGTNPLGDIDLSDVGAVYEIKTNQQDIGVKTRAIKIKPKEEGKESGASEFYEGSVKILTK